MVTLYRRVWLATAVGCALAAGVITLMVTPRYTAECVVLIEPGKVNLTDFKDVYDPAALEAGGAREEFIRTQQELLLSAPVLEKVFVQFDFAKTPPFRGAPDPLPAFRRCFRVEPIRRTRLARVTFTWRDPELAARALHHLVRTYIEEYRRRRLGVTAEGLALLKSKAAELRPQVEAKAKALQEFLAAHNTVSFEEDQDILRARLRELSTKLSQVVARRVEMESRYTTVRAALAGKRPLEELPEVAASPTVRELRLDLARVAQQIQDVDARLGRRHPEMQRLLAQERVLREELQAEMRRIAQAAAAECERVRQEEGELRRAVARQEERVMERNRLLVRYNLLKNAYETANESYRAVIKRIDEIEIASATGTKEDNIFEIAAPRVPTAPSYPRRRQAVALAALGGLLLGLGLSFLLHALDRTLKTAEETEGALGVPVLGHVPPARRRGAPESEARERPAGHFAEAFRSVRTALLLSRAGGPPGCLVVSSAAPGDGKDVVSLNLAVALARSGKEVLLLDGDLRRPRQHRLWRVPGRRGLSTYLAGAEDEATALLQRTEVEGLTLLPAGPCPPNPLELLSSARWRRLLGDLRRRFEAVVINSPPLGAVTDGVVLGREADGVVLVVRSFTTRREDAQQAVALLRRAEVPLLGVVMNLADVPRTAATYYGSHYGCATYTYGDEETPAPPAAPSEAVAGG